MNKLEEDYQDHLTSMLIGPDIIYAIMVLFTDGSTKLYTFSEEEYQLSYVEYLQEAGEDMGMVSATLFESILNAHEIDYKELSRVH